MAGISFLLGERHRERTTDEIYEGGIIGAGSSKIRYTSHFYLIAMFFVIFDLESIFLYAWAIAVPDLGWAGFFQILIFIFILLAALGYLWRMGALDIFHKDEDFPQKQTTP
jgi:NADH-quinone oxidoreductase subunit A